MPGTVLPSMEPVRSGKIPTLSQLVSIGVVAGAGEGREEGSDSKLICSISGKGVCCGNESGREERER